MNEILYQMTIYQMRKMLKHKLITPAQFRKMERMMIEKYKPTIGRLLYQDELD